MCHHPPARAPEWAARGGSRFAPENARACHDGGCMSQLVPPRGHQVARETVSYSSSHARRLWCISIHYPIYSKRFGELDSSSKWMLLLDNIVKQACGAHYVRVCGSRQ